MSALSVWEKVQWVPAKPWKALFFLLYDPFCVSAAWEWALGLHLLLTRSCVLIIISPSFWSIFFFQEAFSILDADILGTFLKAAEQLKAVLPAHEKAVVEERSKDVCERWKVRKCT